MLASIMTGKAEIKPVNLIRVMPAQGRMANCPFSYSISLSFLRIKI
jgi:hypothetical protein